MKSKPARALISVYFVYMIINWFSPNNQHYPMTSFIAGVAAFIVILSLYYFFTMVKKLSQGLFDIKEEWAEILFWVAMAGYWILRLIDTY